MENWDLDATVNEAFGSKKWIKAEIVVRKNTYPFSSSDLDFGGPLPIKVDVLENGVKIDSVGNDGRRLSIALSPALMNELIEAYCRYAAQSGGNFPHAETARALMTGGTSIVNRRDKT